MKRRALEVDEIRQLLTSTATRGCQGPERALLYHLALESGLRASELRSLTVGSFDFEQNTVELKGAYAKNRQTAVLPLRPPTVAMLHEHFTGKLPDAKAFQVPVKTADMLWRDLTAAGIEWQDTGAGVLDFHSLRHSFCTLLVNSGVSVKAAQVLMRHSTAELTLNRYSHLYRGQDAEALAQLPDFDGAGEAAGRGTGTDDWPVDDGPKETEKYFAINLAKTYDFERTFTDFSGPKRERGGSLLQNTKPALECNKTH